LRDRLAIRHLRRADVRLDLELALHAVDQDVEMKLAHALDDGLTALVVRRHAERRIFAAETIERDAHLLLVGLGLRLDRQLDHGLGEFHPLEDDRCGQRAERVAGRGVLEARESDDVAGKASWMSSRLFACISSMRPTFSFLSFTEFRTPMRCPSCPNRCGQR
jgi:hypothetical protein